MTTTTRTLYHTSPTEIATITADGTYGSCLCFASEPYVMTAAGSHVTYTIEIDDDSIVEASAFRIIDSPAVDAAVIEIAELVGCDENTALDLLSERISLCETECSFSAESDWAIQRIAGECAAALGYRGVELTDEQGALYLLDMLGREAELQAASDD